MNRFERLTLNFSLVPGVSCESETELGKLLVGSCRVR